MSVAESARPQIQTDPPGAPGSLLKQATKGLTAKMKEMKVGHDGTDESGGAEEAAADVNKPLPPAPVAAENAEPSPGIRRQDSETGEVDEFQDAEA